MRVIGNVIVLVLSTDFLKNWELSFSTYSIILISFPPLISSNSANFMGYSTCITLLSVLVIVTAFALVQAFIVDRLADMPHTSCSVFMQEIVLNNFCIVGPVLGIVNIMVTNLDMTIVLNKIHSNWRENHTGS